MTTHFTGHTSPCDSHWTPSKRFPRSSTLSTSQRFPIAAWMEETQLTTTITCNCLQNLEDVDDMRRSTSSSDDDRCTGQTSLVSELLRTSDGFLLQRRYRLLRITFPSVQVDVTIALRHRKHRGRAEVGYPSPPTTAASQTSFLGRFISLDLFLVDVRLV